MCILVLKLLDGYKSDYCLGLSELLYGMFNVKYKQFF